MRTSIRQGFSMFQRAFNHSSQLFSGNCFDVLPTLPEASCDLLLTDPPFGTTNLSFDKVKIDWVRWWSQIHRVCRPNAVMVLFAAQPFATDLINSNRKEFRYDLIWAKPYSVGFLSANVRPLRSHELLLIFGRAGHCRDAVYNPQMTAGAPYRHRARKSSTAHYGEANRDVAKDNPGTRYPTSVLNYGRDAGGKHPTQKPVDLLRYLMRTFSHPGARVLDTFMGVGSTGVAAALEGRAYVGIELDPAYYQIAETRIGEKRGGTL